MAHRGLPGFQELYVVSDIHMGGDAGFQILKEGARLGAFIESLCTVTPEHDIALVLNGDVIDSLAEPGIDGYVATGSAEAMMSRIYDDPSFKPVWDALETFVHTGKRHLVIAIGNHDIELALPGVARSIVERIAGDDVTARAAVTFANHGEGFACTVGTARVFCTHGNEVDDFNIVDFAQLSQLGNALNAGREIELEKWQPNAGTRIVIDVMNSIKRQYPFIDLLKPETKAAVGVLAVLAPDLLGASLWRKETVAILKALRTGSQRVSALLSAQLNDVAEITQPQLGSEILVESFLGPHLKDAMRARQPAHEDADDLLMEVERAVIDGEAPSAGLESEDLETLGMTDRVVRFFVDRITGVPKAQALRMALLDWLDGDTTFDIDTKDATFEAITKRVGPDVDFVVTGHTHLYRALSFGVGSRRYYYNCGTWIRLLGFTREVLEDPKAFDELFEVLASGQLSALDGARIPGPRKRKVPLVMDRSTAVRIHADGKKTHGELLQVKWANGKVTTAPIAESQFTKV